MDQVFTQQLEALWAITTGHPSICIAVLDGPVEISHRCFDGASLREIDVFQNESRSAGVSRQHGTQIASILFGQHGSTKVRGIAPKCRGLIIPIYESSELGPQCSQASLAEAIRAAIDHGAHIINVSGGQLWDKTNVEPALLEAITRAAQIGVPIVAAAGNDGCSGCEHVPAALPWVIPVGATDEKGDIHASTNRSETYSRRGLTAPGVGILCAAADGGTTTATGTSFATAIMSGGLGLLASLYARADQLTQIRNLPEIVLSTCDPSIPDGNNKSFFVGRLNIGSARESIVTSLHNKREKLAMSSVSESPVENLGDIANVDISSASKETVGASFQNDGIEPSGCGCGCTKESQYVYAVGQLDVDFLNESRKLSLYEHDDTDEIFQIGGLRLGRVTETIGGLFRYLLGVDIDALAAALDCEGATTNQQKHRNAGRGEKRDLLKCLSSEQLGALCDLLKTEAFNGHLYDAESIQWVLRQDNCPLYVLRPGGAFGREAYQQILIFFIEQVFSTLTQFQCEFIRPNCVESFYPCNGGTQEDFLECLDLNCGCDDDGESDADSSTAEAKHADHPKQESKPRSKRPKGDPSEEEPDPSVSDDAFALLGEGLSCASHVAIAGEIVGKTRLYTGETVPVVAPVLRGCANWNSKKLIPDPEDGGTVGSDLIRAAKIRILTAFYEHVRNPGLTDCDRAKNYWTTQVFDAFSNIIDNKFFLALFGIDQTLTPDWQLEALKIAPAELSCQPASCNPLGARTMDVELSFYKFDNNFGGDVVLSQPIDVADVVPTIRGKQRVFQRRRR
jgi:hypothetical protein